MHGPLNVKRKYFLNLPTVHPADLTPHTR